MMLTHHPLAEAQAGLEEPTMASASMRWETAELAQAARVALESVCAVFGMYAT
jgi:hypothetical protein